MNGWKNYPTWAVNLWLSNDEGLYNDAREVVKWTRKHNDNPEILRVEVADALRAWVRDDLLPNLGSTFAADLLAYSLALVDWFEIADAWLEEIDAS